MEHWVDVPPEPAELVLTWRAPEGIDDRTRWAAGILSVEGGTPRFRYLEGEEFDAANPGRTPAQLIAQGFRGYPAFQERRGNGKIFTQRVLDAFLRRLPPAARPDFPAYMELYRYRGAPLAPMSLLALTSARLPSDGFALVDRLDPASMACDTVIEIAGFRHRAADPALLRDGADLRLVPEPTNPHDPAAIRVEAAGATVGYVNRLQTSSMAAWLKDRDVSCWLSRRGGRAESPVAFGLLRMRCREKALAA